MLTSVTYGSLVYEGEVGVTVLKSSLCRVIFHQPVALHMDSVRQSLVSGLLSTYTSIDISVTSVEVFAQEELLVNAR